MTLSRRTLWALAAGALFAAAISVLLLQLAIDRLSERPPEPPPAAEPERRMGERFVYAFNKDGVLQESEEQDTSSPYWWLNSGGELIIKGGIGSTVRGDLPPLDPWRINYGLHNPADTDGGYRPQNVFRLISRGSWTNPRISLSFRIMTDNLSDSANRNETNGVFLMSRYVDGQTLYYAGLRSDGKAIVKKKYHGTYYTLAEQQVFAGNYDRERAGNLLPHSEWLRMESETLTIDGSVRIRLYLKRHTDDSATLLLEAYDDGGMMQTPPIHGSARIGVRTDFMDVEFEDIQVMEMDSAS